MSCCPPWVYGYVMMFKSKRNNYAFQYQKDHE